MRIELDPETGGWRLAPMGLERSREAEAAMMLNQSDAGLVSESLPGGGVKIDLQGRFQSYSMVSVGLDGRLQSGCVESPFAVEAWLSGYVSNPAPPAFPVK